MNVYGGTLQSSGVSSSHGLWDETVSESGGFSPDAAVPPARRQQTQQFVAIIGCPILHTSIMSHDCKQVSYIELNGLEDQCEIEYHSLK